MDECSGFQCSDPAVFSQSLRLGRTAQDFREDRSYHTVITADGSATHWQSRVGYYFFLKTKKACEAAGKCDMVRSPALASTPPLVVGSEVFTREYSAHTPQRPRLRLVPPVMISEPLLMCVGNGGVRRAIDSLALSAHRLVIRQLPAHMRG